MTAHVTDPNHDTLIIEEFLKTVRERHEKIKFCSVHMIMNNGTDLFANMAEVDGRIILKNAHTVDYNEGSLTMYEYSPFTNDLYTLVDRDKVQAVHVLNDHYRSLFSEAVENRSSTNLVHQDVSVDESSSESSSSSAQIDGDSMLVPNPSKTIN